MAWDKIFQIAFIEYEVSFYLLLLVYEEDD